MAKKKIYSIKDELLRKSRESMLAAVEIYNNPNITFKAETFITLAIISWTYVMHAYYKKINVEYAYFNKQGSRKKYDKTKYGAIKHWELERCINDKECPLDFTVKSNLKFLIGIRHEIEHQMTSKIDNAISAKLQACALNYNHFIKTHFGNKFGIDEKLALCIQFAAVDPMKYKELSKMKGLSENIINYITEFEKNLDENTIINPEYAYRVLYIPINVNNKGRADSIIEFVRASDEVKDEIKNLVMLKETEKAKYLPNQIVKLMKEKGYNKFSMTIHTSLWQNNGNSLKIPKYGCNVAGKQWYWYDSWIKYVEVYCKNNNL